MESLVARLEHEDVKGQKERFASVDIRMATAGGRIAAHRPVSIGASLAERRARNREPPEPAPLWTTTGVGGSLPPAPASAWADDPSL